MTKLVYALFLSFITISITSAQDQSGYMKPPPAMVDLVDAPSPPSVQMSPDKSWIMFAHRSPLPTIKELAQPELRLAGLRINPRIFTRSRQRPINNIRFQKPGEKMERGIKNLPSDLKIQHFAWAPDSKHIAFSHETTDGLELWIADTKSFQAKRIGKFHLNSTMTSPMDWIDGEQLLVLKAPFKTDEAPQRAAVPSGPNIKENLGLKAPVRTYQDMITNKHDEDLFEFYTTAQLATISVSGEVKDLGEPAIYETISPSPDGLMIMAKKIQKPFSYIVPYYRFPIDVEILNRSGELTQTIAEIPIQEKRPKGFDATQSGPRNHDWRSDKPHQIYYVEALDAGDPNKDVEKRDAVYLLNPPYDGEREKLFETSRRFSYIQWGNDEHALMHERWWTSRNQVITLIDPSGARAPKELVNRSTQDRYSDPGNAIMKRNDYGQYVLDINKNNEIYWTGDGASPQGDRPFVEKMNLDSGTSEKIWQSEAPYYEIPYGMINEKKQIWLTRRESPEENPNFFTRNIKRDKLTQLTAYSHPYPNLKDIQKEIVQYEREDGLMLSAELYLPADYKKEDGPLPTLVWAYPREYKSKDDAAQMNGSPYEFKSLSFYGPIPWVTQGYAVFNSATMPIIGEGDEEPNDSFREQLVASAKAVIDEGVRRGVTDPQRVGVGGHSYGAFMTANLLAHSDLFAAGIARSGAYNRTLTPFGFQREERTYWEDPDLYNYMSPFMHADKVNEPILLLHGEADNNSGTFPIQSKRFYHALKGHGAVARYVTLPHESHGYRARESVLHMLYEQNTWLETYVKNAEHTIRP